MGSMTREFERIVSHFLSSKSNRIWRANASHYIRRKAPESISIQELCQIYGGFTDMENLLELLLILLSDGQRTVDDISQIAGSIGEISWEPSLSMDQLFLRLELLVGQTSLINAFDPYHLLSFAVKSIIVSPLCLKRALLLLGKLQPRFKISDWQARSEIEILVQMLPLTETFLIELLFLCRNDLSTDHLILLLNIFCSASTHSARMRISTLFNELPSWRKEDVIMSLEALDGLNWLQSKLLLNSDEMLESKLQSLLDCVFNESKNSEVDAILKDWEQLDGKKKELFLAFAFDFLIKTSTRITSGFIKLSIFSSQKFKNFSKVTVLLPIIFEFCILNGTEGQLIAMELVKMGDIKRNWEVMLDLLQKYEALFIETGLLEALYEDSLKYCPASLGFVLSFDRELPAAFGQPIIHQLIGCIEKYPMLLDKLHVRQFLAEHMIEFLWEASSDLLRRSLPLLELDLEKILSWVIISVDIIEMGKVQAIIELAGKREDLGDNCLSAMQEIAEKIKARLDGLPDPDEELYLTLIEAIEHDHTHVVGYSSCCSECYCD